ncbi:MAG: hypothetical protein M1546_08770 [Chloroflexi bacterium]|nr:hypothetical protein [Chloroflexota bacterium]
MQFLDRASATGRIKPDMAGRLAAAVRKVLEFDHDWEETDMSQVDVENVLARFRNLSALAYSPGSLIEYERRFKRAKAMFLEYVQDPSHWKQNGQMAQNKKTTTKKQAGKTKRKTVMLTTLTPPTQNEMAEMASVATNPAGIQMIDYPFPLRDACIVRLRLPADLKTAEVERLTLFMRSVAVDAIR